MAKGRDMHQHLAPTSHGSDFCTPDRQWDLFLGREANRDREQANAPRKNTLR